MKPAVTVYGASSPKIDPIFTEAARLVGSLLAHKGMAVVCGGGRSGLMAATIEGAIDAGGEAVGVLPAFMVERGWQHPALTSLEVTPDMHARKELMAHLSRGIIALPGGVGTLEELLEIITWRQLGLYHGNVVILNTDGYYDLLIEMLNSSIARHFMNPDHRSLWHVTTDPREAVDIASTPSTDNRPFTQKIV